MRLKGKNIVLGLTASIAAYKIPILVRLLKKEGADVQVVMTPSARDFVTPLTLSTLSGRSVFSVPFDPIDGSWNSHVEMGQWADIMIFAPLSAATMAKMANGLSDNLLTTTYLSAKCPVYFAPAMDLDMYAHPTTQRNIETLLSLGHTMIEAQTGELASGLCGAGRMEEPENILEIVVEHFKKKSSFLGKTVLMTAGPTYESIDPVRFIGNFSTGKMGYAITIELLDRGANVILISGPVNLKASHPNLNLVSVTSAADMYEQAMKYYSDSDIAILTAAVADYRPKKKLTSKIKKSDQSLTIDLEPTIDILKNLGENKKGQFLMGFALETDHERDHAQHKLEKKNCDAIILNSMNDKGAGFGYDTNKISIFSKNNAPIDYDLKSKKEVAKDICNFLEKEIAL